MDRIENYLTRLYGYAVSLARDPETAKDLVRQGARRTKTPPLIDAPPRLSSSGSVQLVEILAVVIEHVGLDGVVIGAVGEEIGHVGG